MRVQQKLLKRSLVSTLILTSTFCLVLTSKLQAVDECSNATLKGSFGFSGSGTFALTTPFVAIGRITYDGKGNLEATASVSTGTVVARFPFSGTYAVNSDCTGSVTFSDGTTSDIVIDDDGTEVRFIRTDTGVLNSGVGRKQFPGRHDPNQD